ncbi:MAG: SDR family oxidoreductase [Candidatus Zixiibacteriota bacterium]|nr:MAG: SDR family oxidoreductase [candidate division Zixibacteria bacterium]
MSDTVFLTGATGFVGRNLIPRILRLDPNIKLVLLIRGKTDHDVKRRFEELIESLRTDTDMEETADRITPIRGDITLKNLGILEPIYNKLAREVTHIIHAAANVNFQQTLEEARCVNLGGTRNVIKFADCARINGNLKRFAYVGTAYISGNRKGLIFENELDYPRKFANAYERSKFETEKLLQHWKTMLPITIFRPSIIVGDSTTGITSAFNVIYSPLKFICRGFVRILPGSRKTALDVVPVDFVCDAICHIALKKDTSDGKIYHLTAGKKTHTTTGEIVRLSLDYINNKHHHKKIRKIRFIPPALFRLVRQFLGNSTKRILQAFAEYEPYMSIGRIFDNRNTLEALEGTNIAVPPFSQYYRSLLEYCVRTKWGKRLGNATG